MKKIILMAICAIMSLSTYAQEKGDIAAGVNVSYGSEIKSVGIGVEGQYNITDKIRTELGFDYFLEKDGLKMWDLNLNFHYLIPLSESFKIYPLVGVSYTNWTLDYGFELDDEWADYMEDLGYDSDDTSDSEGKFGVNVGCGFQYDLSSKLVLNAEAKYQIISDFDQFVVSVGLAYKF
ncbi:MAG: porin family protein [Prevotellaceae bacterium]|nr:porin family protein [Prevotellaceae bacterium]